MQFFICLLPCIFCNTQCNCAMFVCISIIYRRIKSVYLWSLRYLKNIHNVIELICVYEARGFSATWNSVDEVDMCNVPSMWDTCNSIEKSTLGIIFSLNVRCRGIEMLQCLFYLVYCMKNGVLRISKIITIMWWWLNQRSLTNKLLRVDLYASNDLITSFLIHFGWITEFTLWK